MVVTGIMIGNWTRQSGFSEQSRHHLDHFWELMDQFLNALLFLLIGLALVLLTSPGKTGSCWSSRCLLPRRPLHQRLLPYVAFRKFRSYKSSFSVRILTWGGLRGGLWPWRWHCPRASWCYQEHGVDLREVILVMTHSVVMFSHRGTGMTITPDVITAAKKASGDH